MQLRIISLYSHKKGHFIYTNFANELLDLLQAYKPEPDPMTLA